MTPDELAEIVKGAKACYICLVVGHTLNMVSDRRLNFNPGLMFYVGVELL